MNRSALVSSFVFVLLASLNSHAILNGRSADPRSSETTVILDARSSGARRACSGVVVNRHLILLAGHCLEGEVQDLSETFHANVTNAIRNNGIGKLINVVKWNRVHGYTSNDEKTFADTQRDLGYVITQEDLYAKLNIDPEFTPSLMSNQDELEAAIAKTPYATTYGYGYAKRAIRDDRDSSYDRKNEVVQSVRMEPTTKSLIATSLEKNKGICEGDSGGGLLFDSEDGHMKLAGILSGRVKTEDCGQTGARAIYVNIVPHICWIQKDSGIDLALKGCL